MASQVAPADDRTTHGGPPRPEYVPTLVNGVTPPTLRWAGRIWRVNSGAIEVPNMAYSIRISPDAQRIRFELRNTENDRGAREKLRTRRAELSGSLYGDKRRLPNGKSLWGAHAFIHHRWADPEGMKHLWGGVFGQIHMGSKFGGSPALAFRRAGDGQFTITTRGEFDPSGTVRYRGPVSFDDVHDLVYNVVLHPTDGRLKVWLDGRQIVAVERASIGHSNAESYWNFGLYFAGGVTSPVVAEYGNHVYPGEAGLEGRTRSPPPWGGTAAR